VQVNCRYGAIFVEAVWTVKSKADAREQVSAVEAPESKSKSNPLQQQ
jgi:hypothetical protein